MAVDFAQGRGVASIDERPVFAARSARRPRILRMGGRAAAVVTTLWLVGLVVGGFGFGYLPGLQLPSSHKASQKPSTKPGATHPTGVSDARRAAATAHRLGRGRLGRRGGLASHDSSSPGRTSRGSHSGRGPGGTTPSRNTKPASGGSRSTRGYSTHSVAPGSRSQTLTAPGRAHSPATPSPGSGDGRTTTTRGNDHSTKAAALQKSAQ